jgi:hypothetical protein
MIPHTPLQTNTQLGNLVLQTRPNTARVMFFAVPLLLIAIVLIGTALLAAIPEGADRYTYTGSVIIGMAGIPALLLALRRIHGQYSSDVYENGLVLRRGSRTLVLHFNEISARSRGKNVSICAAKSKHPHLPLTLKPAHFHQLKLFTQATTRLLEEKNY